MRYFFIMLCSVFIFVGCSNTARGISKDTKNAVDWTKEKINDGATYVKEKTE